MGPRSTGTPHNPRRKHDHLPARHSHAHHAPRRLRNERGHGAAREASRSYLTSGGFGDDSTIPVYEVEYEEGYEPFSEHGAIVALVGEVLRLRGVETDRKETA